jgi:hypothetical protein
MRAMTGLLALTLSACGGSEAPRGNTQQPVRAPLNAQAPKKAEPVQNNISEAAPQADPGLVEMSPSRRRAYDRGFADCRAGRYDPDPYPEAYRIGCAAANDR